MQSESCYFCGFNTVVKEMEAPRTYEDQLRFFDRSHCSLRVVNIMHTSESTCDNWMLYIHKNPPTPQITAPIYAPGFRENNTDALIPWHGSSEPHKEYIRTCSLCGRGADRGIEVADNSDILTFCSNYCYAEFWSHKHGNEWEWCHDFKPPEMPIEDYQRYDLYRSEPDERNYTGYKEDSPAPCGTFLSKVNRDLRNYLIVKEGASLDSVPLVARERAGDVTLWKPGVLLWKLCRFFDIKLEGERREQLVEQGYVVLRKWTEEKESVLD